MISKLYLLGNPRLDKNRLFLISCAAVMVCIINMAWLHYFIIGISSLFIYFLSTGWHFGRLFNNAKNKKTVWFFGITTLLLIIILINVVVYYIYKINDLSVSIILTLPLFSFILQWKTNLLDCETKKNHGSLMFYVFTVVFIITETILFIWMIKKQTIGLLPSPWQILDYRFFLTYAVASMLLIWLLSQNKSQIISISALILHLLATFSVAPIIYTLGYGFDAIIHQTTEEWIKAYGMIAPKEPFYIGQYSFVVWLSYLTQISIKRIDTWLVPALSSISLPLFISYALKKTWSIQSSWANSLCLIVPVCFFFSFHLTTPHNIVLLLGILTSFSILLYWRNILPEFILWLIGLVAVATHPLIGMPILVLIVTAWLINHWQSKLKQFITIAASSVCIMVLPLAMFLIRLKISGYPLPKITNPIPYLPVFFSLFGRPYWYAKAGWMLELLYGWQRWLVVLIILLGIFGWIIKRKEDRKYWLFLGTILSLWIGSFLLHTLVTFPGVNQSEQGNYPIRLLIASITLILPWTTFAIYWIGKKIAELCVNNIQCIKIIKFSAIFISGILLMLSFYLAYPQRNPKVQFPGFNLIQADIDAVKYIHKDNLEYNYVVLANSITSAGALREYSFIKYFDTEKGKLFYYSIPTGGSLYELYQRMMYKGQKPETMIEAMDLTKTDKAYFVISSYWKNFDLIVANAKKTANSWQMIGNNEIYIFTYKRPSP